jgi:hypothetical protein
MFTDPKYSPSLLLDPSALCLGDPAQLFQRTSKISHCTDRDPEPRSKIHFAPPGRPIIWLRLVHPTCRAKLPMVQDDPSQAVSWYGYPTNPHCFMCLNDPVRDAG